MKSSFLIRFLFFFKLILIEFYQFSFSIFSLLLISGDQEASINTLLDILPVLEDQATGHEMRLLVHQSQAGCIIGRGGDKIKDLRTVRDFKQ
jgi:heterogeneous nuclear ribonucleoprotein K